MTLSLVKAKLQLKQGKEDCFGGSWNRLERIAHRLNTTFSKKKKKAGEFLRVEFKES